MFRFFDNGKIAIFVFVLTCLTGATNGVWVRAAEAASPLPRISVPIADKTPNITRSDIIGSAFLVSYREKVFVLTNAHVVLNAGIAHQFAFRDDKNWIPLQTRWTFGKIDVVAIDVTAIISPNKAGLLRLGIADLVPGKTPLTVLCNPDNYPEPFIGLYSGIADGEIELQFAGQGLAVGCSGAPVLDNTHNVRGIIFGRIPGSAADKIKWGYAISADAIAQFLNEKFFR